MMYIIRWGTNVLVGLKNAFIIVCMLAAVVFLRVLFKLMHYAKKTFTFICCGINSNAV